VLFHLGLQPMCLGKMEHLVRLAGVGVLQRVEVVGKAHRCGHLGHLGEHLADLCHRDALVAGEEVHLAALEVDRGVGRQLEGVVLDLNGPVSALLVVAAHALLEAALAHIAPGTGDVGPDVDLQDVGHQRFSLAQDVVRCRRRGQQGG
jgi:hypothetical protein